MLLNLLLIYKVSVHVCQFSALNFPFFAILKIEPKMTKIQCVVASNLLQKSDIVRNVTELLGNR